MDILRNLFGSLTSGIIRLLVAVGILAAAYYFVLRPVLDTANRGIDKGLGGVSREVQREVRRSLHLAQKQGNPKRLIKCIEHADGDARKIRRCTVKF